MGDAHAPTPRQQGECSLQIAYLVIPTNTYSPGDFSLSVIRDVPAASNSRMAASSSWILT